MMCIYSAVYMWKSKNNFVELFSSTIFIYIPGIQNRLPGLYESIYIYSCKSMYSLICNYNLLSLCNVICMYMLTNWCDFSWGRLFSLLALSIL